MTMGAVVAKKNTGPGRPAKSHEPESERAEFVRVRVSKAWKDWLGRLADANQLTMSDLINQAVIKFAKDQGFEPPPKR